MITSLLLDEFRHEQTSQERLQNLLRPLRAHFACGAVCLLKLEGDVLQPVATDGLARETLGRRFRIDQHPRLAGILESHAPCHYPLDSPLPDPYDGLIDNHLGEPLPVHDCMGVALYQEGRLWGALTLDALVNNVFQASAERELAQAARVFEVAIHLARLEEENQRLRSKHFQIGTMQEVSPDETRIIGNSPQMLALLQELDIVAESDLPILLLGETGVGKELFARRIHQASRRCQATLSYINCAALPESLAESELFGHVKGAFSGAAGERVGRIEAAEGGTLFLDEVGELPLSVQAKLLRTLQNGEIQRLGADQPHKVDVRIVAATNRQLHERVREGHFRADLYHRLSVYPVHIPPLRERVSDVLLLAGNFLEINRTRLGLRSLRLSPRAEAALHDYAWPGNIRELEHVISRAALRALSRGAERTRIVTLEAAHLDLDLQAPSPEKPAPPVPEAADLPLKTALDTYQRQLVQQALEKSQGNWAAAARRLGLDTSNLHKLSRRLGLK